MAWIVYDLINGFDLCSEYKGSPSRKAGASTESTTWDMFVPHNLGIGWVGIYFTEFVNVSERELAQCNYAHLAMAWTYADDLVQSCSKKYVAGFKTVY